MNPPDTPIRGNNQQAWYRLFLVFLSLLGGGLVFWATSSLGPGLGEDSAKYLSVAENILAGRDFVYYNAYPLAQWPPLYPMLLAGLHLATGIDAVQIAQALNILAVSALIFAGGLLLERAFPHRRILAVFASILITFSPPIISIASNVSTDPLFIFLVVLFLLVAGAYLHKESFFLIVMLVCVTVLASYLRYAGLSLVLTGGAIVFFSKRKELVKGVIQAGSFMAVTGLPLLLWALLHNYPRVGLLFGGHLRAVPIQNITITIDKIFGWFFPILVLDIVAPWLILGLLFILILSGNRRQDWSDFARRLTDSAILPSALFLIVYGFMLIFYTSTSESRYLGFDRLHVVILPALLVVGLTGFENLLPKYLYSLPVRLLQSAIYFGLIVFALISIYDAQKYVRVTAQNGDIYYNNIVTQELQQSDLVAYLDTLELTGSDVLYSNNDSVAWYYVRHPITVFPRNYEEVVGEASPDWPPQEGTGVLVWFHGSLDYTPGVTFPDRALELGWLTPLFTSDLGDVYRFGRHLP